MCREDHNMLTLEVDNFHRVGNSVSNGSPSGCVQGLLSAAKKVKLYPPRATGQGVEEGNKLHNSEGNCCTTNLGPIILQPPRNNNEVVRNPGKITGGGVKEASELHDSRGKNYTANYGGITQWGSRGSNGAQCSSMQNQGKVRPSNSEATVKVYSRRKPANYGVTRSLGRSRFGAMSLINGKLRTAATVVNPSTPKQNCVAGNLRRRMGRPTKLAALNPGHDVVPLAAATDAPKNCVADNLRRRAGRSPNVVASDAAHQFAYFGAKKRRSDIAVVMNHYGEQTCADGNVRRSGRAKSFAAVADSDAAVTTATPASKATQTMEDASASTWVKKTPFPVKKRTIRTANPGSSWIPARVTKQVVEPAQDPEMVQIIAARRSRRPRKHSTWYSNENFLSTVSDEFEWSTFYPDTPYTPEPPRTVEFACEGHVDGGDAGNIGKYSNNQLETWVLGEVVTLSADSSSDAEDSADVHKPRKAQRTGPRSSKARKISFPLDPTVIPLSGQEAQIVLPEIEILDEGIRSEVTPQLECFEAKQRHLRKILDAILGVHVGGIGHSGYGLLASVYILCHGPAFSMCVFLLSGAQDICQSAIVQQVALIVMMKSMGFLRHYADLTMVYPTFRKCFFDRGQLKSVSGDAYLRLESPQCRVSRKISLSDEQFEKAGSPVYDDTDVGPPTPEKVHKRKRSPTLPRTSNCLRLTADTLENGTQFVLSALISNTEAWLQDDGSPPDVDMNEGDFTPVQAEPTHGQHMSAPTNRNSNQDDQTRRLHANVKLKKKRFTPKVRRPVKFKVSKLPKKSGMSKRKPKASSCNCPDALVRELPDHNLKTQDARSPGANALPKEATRTEGPGFPEREYLNTKGDGFIVISEACGETSFVNSAMGSRNNEGNIHKESTLTGEVDGHNCNNTFQKDTIQNDPVGGLCVSLFSRSLLLNGTALEPDHHRSGSPSPAVYIDLCKKSPLRLCNPVDEEVGDAVEYIDDDENCGPKFLPIDEEVPSTPRGNVSTVQTIRTCEVDDDVPVPLSPVSPQQCEEVALTFSEQRKRTKRELLFKGRSTTKNSVWRSLMPEFLSVMEPQVVVPFLEDSGEKRTIIPAPNDRMQNRILNQPIPFSQMDETQREQFIWALSREVEYTANWSKLVKAMTQGIPETDVLEFSIYIQRLLLKVTGKAYDPVDHVPQRHGLQLTRRTVDFAQDLNLQIVPYGDDARKMVLHRDTHMWRPKVKFKPKVVLDSSTVKMFKRLMLKGSAVEDEDQDEVKWDQERQEWDVRANRFNAIMRQIQGDRTFSKWGGSVLDSVGGAFLTQNVSDFLSSMAFMAMRAHFPVRLRDTESATKSEEVVPPLEIESSFENPPARLTQVEANKKSAEETHKQDEAYMKGISLNSSDNAVDEITLDDAEEDPIWKELVTKMKNLVTKMKKFCTESMEDFAMDLKKKTTTNQPPLDGIGLIFDKPPARPTRAELKTKRMEESLKQDEAYMKGISMHSSDNVVDDISLPDDAEDDAIWKELLKKMNTFCIDCKDDDNAVDVENVELLSMCPVTAGLQIETTIAVPVPEAQDVMVGCYEIAKWGQQMRRSSGRRVARVVFSVIAPYHSHSSSIVIREKFKSVVEEDLSSLTALGRETVLAAIIRTVLGKRRSERQAAPATSELKPLEMEMGQWRGRQRRVGAFKTKNHHYGSTMYNINHKFDFRSLKGPELARWEEGFVLESQKEKWEPLRAEILANENYTRNPLTQDCVDWEAVRLTKVEKIADVIKERGMNNILAGRIKGFLDRVHRDQNGSLDLEWIRKLPPDEAKDFLLSVRGLGLKSVECIRLLSLHHPSFPVDTNVGRIVVRLGWVPLEPLPEETQLHLLELYPMQAHIQQYLWPRLCKLDQQTLYEFHYQLITFGKVFCTKSKPNCNACPLRSECKHFASAFSSAKPLLTGPEEHSEQFSTLALTAADPPPLSEETQIISLTQIDAGLCTEQCVPIIEEPTTPETAAVHDIEDFPCPLEVNDVQYLDPVFPTLDSDSTSELPVTDQQIPLSQVVGLEEVLTCDMHLEATENTDVSPVDTEITIEDVFDENLPLEVVVAGSCLPSQELMLLPPEASFTPTPQLKSVQRLRTIHYVYELPDGHPLLSEMDRREADDPCFYLLAIWNPDEVPESMPKINDDDAKNPFASCHNGERESVRGTLLVPCRTAMKGSFPLNGTYFQVNEVFADHKSSIQPLEVPRTLLWSLQRRFVYFGTSVTSLFKDMSQEEIQCCFKKGYVCVRAFDQATRQPKILASRLHQSGAKIVTAPAARKKTKQPHSTKSAHTRDIGEAVTRKLQVYDYQLMM